MASIIDVIILPFQILWFVLVAFIKEFIPRSRKDISNEIVFITGAGSGIGRLMAQKFAACGATVICTDLNKDTADETANIIRGENGKALSYKLDVTKRQDVYDLAKIIKKETGDVTMLVNNAGIVTGQHFMECPDELMIKTMEVNTISHFWTLKAFLGPMIKKNHGHVISIASLAGLFGNPRLIDYCASKFGAVGLMEALMTEMWSTSNGVKCSVVCPYFINTGMFAGVQAKNLLIPPQDPEKVSDYIIKGVLNDEEMIFVPRPLFLGLLFFKSVLPIRVSRLLSKVLDADKAMEGFVGRHGKKE